MNRLVITICFMLLGNLIFAQPTEVQAKKLQGYFFSGNDDMLKDGPNCFVITKKQEFERLFGKGRADTPQFSKEWMLVLLMPATKKDIQLEFNRNTQSRTFICTLSDSHWEEHGDELHYIVRGNRFLRGMVRGLVGTQLQVARGKMSIAEFRQVIEAKDCTLADFSVPGFGLYLEDISYPDGALTEIKN